ncbi:MAG: hypothetical protein HY754_15960 [Nitrospirae bacterium]|nr:hypothetical protein [Nitrospirota bacterium]
MKRNLRRKITLTILSGFFYWSVEYVVIEFFRILNIQFSDWVGKMIYLIFPFLFGVVLVVVIKEKRFVGVVFGSMLIIVSYAISFLEITIRYPAGGNPFEATFWLFKILGVYSIVCSALGGAVGVFLNWKVFKNRESPVDST